MTAVLAGTSGLIILAIIVGLLRRRAVARVAFRQFIRRPAQTILVVAGLLIASLVMSAALVAGDATETMFLNNVYKIWGPVDLVLGTLSGRTFPEAEGRGVLEDPNIKSLSDGGSVRLQVQATAEFPTRGTRESLINLIGIDPASEMSLGRFKASAGGAEITDPQGGILINQRLASRLGAAREAQLTLITTGPTGEVATISLPVTGVVQNTEQANFQLRPNAFVRLDVLQHAIGAPGHISQVVISAIGPAETPRQVKRLEQMTLLVANNAPPGEGLEREDLQYRIAGAKSESVSAAKEQSGFFEGILAALGSIVALTSVALIVNLFVMIGEERRGERAMMRALGLRRGGLFLLGLTEGLFYATTAALLGAAIGGALGRYIGGALVDLYAQVLTDFSVEFARPEFNLNPRTLIGAASAGFLVSVISIAFVSIKTTRMTVVQAIRGLAEDKSSRRRLPILGILAILAGIPLLVFGSLGGFVGADASALMGGALLIIGIASFIRRYANQRLGTSLGGATVLGWGLYGYIYLPDFGGDFNEAFGVVTLAATIVVLAGVVLLATNLTAIERISVFFGSKARVVVRTATAYPVAYRFRTALSMAMFSLVVYMIAAFAIWGGLGSADPETQSGGFEVMAQSTVPIPDFTAEGARSSVAMYSTRYDLGYKVGNSEEFTFPVPLFGVGAEMSTAGFEFLETLGDRSPTDVWSELAGSKNSIILDAGTRPGDSFVGEEVVLNTEKGAVKYKLLGVVDEFWLGGIFLSKEVFRELYPTRAQDTIWLLDAAPGVTPGELAAGVEKKYPGVGLDAKAVADILEDDAATQRTFVGLFTVLLKLGLVIGVTGLAIAAIRTVLERRQAVGVMRALGYQRSMVGASLVLESLLIATLGCGIGLGAGLAGTYWLIDQQLSGVKFTADWAQIWTTLVIVYGAVLLSTLIPATRAARLRPAEAVRYVE